MDVNLETANLPLSWIARISFSTYSSPILANYMNQVTSSTWTHLNKPPGASRTQKIWLRRTTQMEIDCGHVYSKLWRSWNENGYVFLKERIDGFCWLCSRAGKWQCPLPIRIEDWLDETTKDRGGWEKEVPSLGKETYSETTHVLLYCQHFSYLHSTPYNISLSC